MTTFADYVASKPAMDEQISNIENYTVMLCNALYLDAKYRARRHHTNAIAHIEGDTFKGDKEYERAYHIRKIHEIDNQGVDYEFYIKPGRKYHKVMMRTGSSRSVHAFVDKKTGDVFKAASINAPAKGVRFNVLDDNSREEMLERADWAGSYLYVR